jgi:hypothetical protein
MLNYTTVKDAQADRDALRRLLVALGAPKRSLRRDECGAWSIIGPKGYVSSWGANGGWLIYCEAHSLRKWSAIKARLCFCKLTQNGETEGCLRLLKLPTPEQATQIRKALGLRKRRGDAPDPVMITLETANTGVSRAPGSKKTGHGVMPPPEPAVRKSA